MTRATLSNGLSSRCPRRLGSPTRTHIPAQDVRSLDKCWADWSNVATPPLSGALFNSAIEATKRTMLSRLSRPSEGPILIAADSTEEALAFLAQLLGERGGEELASYRDRVLVFDKPGVLPRLAAAAQTFIPVVYTREVERELAPYAKSMHSIVVYPAMPRPQSLTSFSSRRITRLSIRRSEKWARTATRPRGWQMPRVDR